MRNLGLISSAAAYCCIRTVRRPALKMGTSKALHLSFVRTDVEADVARCALKPKHSADRAARSSNLRSG